jgi:hypothetical protein
MPFKTNINNFTTDVITGAGEIVRYFTLDVLSIMIEPHHWCNG